MTTLNNRKRPLTGTAPWLLAALFTMPAMHDAAAQSTPTAEAGPDIIVSASRVPLPARETGSAVTVLTERKLEARGTRVLSDILRDVPGVSVSRSGSQGSFTQIRIRGAEGNHTLVLIDGIEVNDASGGSEFDFANLLSAGVARIEVLRGPQSALYGSDAIGGVINITTKRPKKGWSGSVRVEGGSFATQDKFAHLGYGADKFYVSGTFNRVDSNGPSQADAGNGNSEADEYRNITTRLKAGFKPLPNLSFDAVAMEVDSRNESDASTAVVGSKDDESSAATHQRYGLVKGKWTLLGGAWEHIVRATYADDGTDFLNSSKVRTFLSEGTKTKYDYQTNMTFQTEGSANAEHIVTFAAERETDQQKSSSSVAVTNKGYVGEYRVSLWDHLFLSGSLRFDDNDPLFSDQTTWRGTAAYIHDPWNTRFHGSFGRGVKNPTLFELFGSTPTFTGNPNLSPEESIGVDFGIEKTMYGGRLITDVTLFSNRFENFINGNGNTATNLAGTTKANGIEVTVVAKPIDNFRIDASYTFTSAKDGDGTELIRRPLHVASINGTWNFDLMQRTARANLGVRYNGKQNDTVFDSFSPSIKRTVNLESYTLVNAGFSWFLRDNLEVFARAENLLHQQYQDVFGFGTPGRSFYVGLRVNFGPGAK
jgi:vitamin B12 transporter